MRYSVVLLSGLAHCLVAMFSASALSQDSGSAAPSASAQEESVEPVGEAPKEPTTPQVVVSDRGVRGVLTPSGVTVIEPSLSYGHSSSTVVAIEGFTILPAFIVGLVDVNQVQRDTVTAAFAMRRGFGSRFEAELYVPYVMRDEDVRTREILEGSSADVVLSTDGHGIGDVEASLRYQLNSGMSGGPIYITSLRVKSDTGDGPFDVDRETIFTDDGQPIANAITEQPTGSGFWGVQPSLTFLYTTDPAVIYGGFSYTFNLEDEVEAVGDVDPGDSVGVNLGIGFAINDRTSFSLGYEHNTVFDTDIENDNALESRFDRIQVGSFLVGVSQRLSASTSLNVSVAIGATDDASDVQVTVRLPVSF